MKNNVLLAYYCGGERNGVDFGRSRILCVNGTTLNGEEKRTNALMPPVWM